MQNGGFGATVDMKPTGHIITSGLLAAASYSAGAPLGSSVGIMAGGILIDADHVLDFLLFSSDKHLNPRRIYLYHLNQEYRRVLFALHSYELLLALAALALALSSSFLLGICVGMALHLALDVVFNAGIHLRSVLFYLLLLRLWHRCDVKRLEVRKGEIDPQ